MSSPMSILRDVSEARRWRESLSATTVGLVPTMGALHVGHESLVRAAQTDCDAVVVSIFVNPTQFNDKNDLANYPRPIEQDLALCREWGVDAIFLPDAREMYGDDFAYEIHEKTISQSLCGAFRPGHFTGVLTVVMKLFNAIAPHRAYFGEKDYQQLKLIDGMVSAFMMPVKVVPCPTVRESDGLALSSRNRRLTASDRERAPWIHKVLRSSPTAAAATLELERLGFRVEYVKDKWNRRLCAVFAGDVRLIDNVEL